MASLPTAELRESNVAALDVTAAQEIVEWSVIDDNRMRNTEGAQEIWNSCVLQTWRKGSWDCTDKCVTLSFASRPGVAARTKNCYRNNLGVSRLSITTAEHCKFLQAQNP